MLGFAVAFLLVRYDFAGRSLFSYLTLIPIISPPLVGVLGFTFILGRAGTVNVLLMDSSTWSGRSTSCTASTGCVLVETLHLFPMITLNVVDALGKIDPSLEEAAESVGARGWTKLRTVTLPLTTPGYVAGALLVFIWTFSDFATPLVLGVHDLLASAGLPQHRAVRGPAHLPHGHRDLRADGAARRASSCSRRGATWPSRTTRRSPTRGSRGGGCRRLGQALAVRVPVAVMLLSFIPYIGVALASVGQGLGAHAVAVAYTLQYYERVIVETPKYIVNSFLYSGLAVALCVAVGVPIAWLLAPHAPCPGAAPSTRSTR